MLRLIIGRAGTGKTARIMDEIRDKTLSGETGLILLVPEQYSHDAERRLCAVAGDSLSLHGEVLSFSRLASRIFAETGGAADELIDAGGRILTMYRAMSMTDGMLKAFSGRRRRADALEAMVQTVTELKTAGITPPRLAEAAISATGALRRKLNDLALIYDAYESLLAGVRLDPVDRLEKAASKLDSSSVGSRGHIYVDGFIDFTAPENLLLTGLIRKGADMTVCFTCDSLEGEEELFFSARRAARYLIREAEDRGTEIKIEYAEAAAPKTALGYIERHIFGTENTPFPNSGGVELYRAADKNDEAELAAASVISLLKAGYRLRDIAVVSCRWSETSGLIESTFGKYGVPVYLNRRADILEKPPVALISSALAIISRGWEYDDVFAYLKTGLTGLSADSIDRLENYVITHSIRGNMWTRDAIWSMSGKPDTDEEMDAMRREIAAPLVKLNDSLKKRIDGGHIRALYDFMETISLPQNLESRGEKFAALGDNQLADEYSQLWSILVRAMEQFDGILGDETMTVPEFARVWNLLISQYDVASIPVSLDAVGLGDIARHRRRDIKCLIILGASDGMLPKTTSPGGLLSPAEREELRIIGLDALSCGDDDERRENYDVYASLTLPSERLIISHTADEASGRPSYIMTRISKLTGARIIDADIAKCRLLSPRPCLELAAVGDKTAEALMRKSGREARLIAAKNAAATGRGRLSRETAKRLYGTKMRLSASQAEKFKSCRFAYFLRYGLRAEPRKPAALDAPELGAFYHFVLESVTREVREIGGFANVTDDELRAITEKYTSEYANTKLNGLADRTSRFIYLFRRLCEEISEIVLIMAEELRDSDFSPMDFELEIKKGSDIPPLELTDGDMQLSIEGFVDRVDGWLHNGKLYLRVVDYKTGKKEFSLSDVWYGLGIQMLIYLFAITRNGGERYGNEIVPSGVMYVPARELILDQPRDISPEKLAAERAKLLRRSGIILDDSDVIDAMGHGEGKKYLPIKFKKDGTMSEDNLVSLEQLGILSRHIEKTLREMAREISSGSITADPYFKSAAMNACRYCEYRSACHFSDEKGDKRVYHSRLKTPEVWERLEAEDNG